MRLGKSYKNENCFAVIIVGHMETGFYCLRLAVKTVGYERP